MWDELFPAERATSLEQSVQRPYKAPEAPGFWTGTGSALADTLPYAANTTASAWSAILDAYGKAAAYRDAPTVAMIHGQPVPDMDKLKHETIDQMGNSEVARGFRERAKDFTPDPAAVGLAGQITHGVLSSLVKAGAYSVTAGPAAPVLFGGDLGINRAQELSDQGVDDGTAAVAGTVTAVASAVGMRLPAAMGATRLQSAAIGAAVNPALNVAEIGGIRALLQHADYEKIADQYKPFDPVNLAVATITGGAFGAAFHRGRAPNTPHLTPEEHAAGLTMHEVRVRDGDTLVSPGDAPAASAAHEAQILARQQMEAGEPVSVAHQVAAEQSQLDAAYQRVLDGPAGDAFDPLVHITPDDIEGVVVARGGWHGRGDVEVKGAGWGLVKLIWKHGEESPKAPELQVTREDVLNFPEIIRRFDPAEEATADGNRGRAWRVVRPDADGTPRIVTYADSLINGQKGRHLVSVHVLDDAHAKTAVLSKEKTGVDPESSGLILQSRAGDTAPGVLHSAGQETSVNSNIAQGGIVEKVRDVVSRLLGQEGTPPEAKAPRQAATPEQARAQDIAARNPDAVVRTEDGDVRLADLMAATDEVEARAKIETAAFDAAVNCALRFPQ